MEPTKVLIVDDDKILLKLIGSHFSRTRSPFVPVFADSVEQAKAVLAGDDIAVLVTDLLLPDGTGVELLALAARTYPDLNCIIQSAHTGGLGAVLTSDTVEVLEKPYKPSELAAMIASAADRTSGRGHHASTRDFLLMVEFLGLTCQIKFGAGEQAKGSMLLHRGKMADAFFGSKSGLEAALELIDLNNAWVDVQAFEFNVPPTRKIDLDISEILLARSQHQTVQPAINPEEPLDVDDGMTPEPEPVIQLMSDDDYYARAEHLCSQVAKGMRAEDGFQYLALFGDVARLAGFWSFDDRADGKRSVMQLMQTFTDFVHSLKQLRFGTGNQLLYNASDGILIANLSPPDASHPFTLLLKANMIGKIGLYRLKLETLARDLQALAQTREQLQEVS